MSQKYEFIFTKEGRVDIKFEEYGITPCLARRHAFEYLESFLKQYEIPERQGWRLAKQAPIFD